MELLAGGLRKQTIIAAGTSGPKRVGYLQVVDHGKPWSLRCKYKWSEETVSSASGKKLSFQQNIGAGVVLIVYVQKSPQVGE